MPEELVKPIYETCKRSIGFVELRMVILKAIPFSL